VLFIKLSGENGIPSVFEAVKTSFKNFDIASGKTEEEHNRRMASDSDVFKNNTLNLRYIPYFP